jgi:thioredoxin-like negative regulator of GroEL
MFVGVNSQLNSNHREQALEAAQMRDQATYQLALIYRAQNKPDQAVPLLMEILRSQQPTRELGQRAYQQLFEIGFVSQPYAGSTTVAPEAEAE